MATTLLDGQLTWSGQRDEEGHRDYRVTWLVKGDVTDGPANALSTPGLPLPGAPWLIDNDADIWAWCRPTATITPKIRREGEPNRYWLVEQTFSTRPTGRCQDISIEDPLLEPPRISGTFIKYVEEATHDLIGPLTNSAHEQLRGPQVEFEHSRPTIRIEQNVPTFAGAVTLPTLMMNAVNRHVLWGLPPRTIKLSNLVWEKVYFGFCEIFYRRMLEFEIRFDTFDRSVLDEGTKVLNGHFDDAGGVWQLDDIGGEPPDPTNPFHFIRYKDRNGDYTRVTLDGQGKPFIPLIPDGSAPQDIVATTVCADAPQLRLGTRWPADDGDGQPQSQVLNVGETHYFKIAVGKGDSRRIEFSITAGDIVDPDSDVFGSDIDLVRAGFTSAGLDGFAGDCEIIWNSFGANDLYNNDFSALKRVALHPPLQRAAEGDEFPAVTFGNIDPNAKLTLVIDNLSFDDDDVGDFATITFFITLIPSTLGAGFPSIEYQVQASGPTRGSSQPGTRQIIKHPPADFVLLGIPLIL